MAVPSITVRIAFASNPLDTPVWTDVTSYVRFDQPITIRRGRQQALGRMEAGTLALTLDNRDRRFDPTHTGSPYYPYVVPNRRIGVQATWLGTTYDLFTGYIDEWPPEWPASDDSSVAIRATDAFKFFSRKKITLSRGPEYSGDRINAVLTALGWPGSDAAISAGQSLVQAVSLDKSTVLQHLLDVALAENGVLFMEDDGKITFHNRHWALTQTTATTTQAIFGDSGTELPYTALQPSYDDSELYNEILVTRVGGTTQSAIDTTSQTTYLPLTLERSGLLITSDLEASDAANWLLKRYASPGIRFKAITVDGQTNTNIWPHALGRTFGERITVRRRPPGGGTLIQQDCLIEAVSHQISTTRWATTWQLSPANSAAYFVFDSATLGIFDTSPFAY